MRTRAAARRPCGARRCASCCCARRFPRPPPNVDFSLLEDANSRLATARERLDLHRTNPVCAGCHKITDPIGLAFEHFDGAGQYRATEHGAAIDPSGALDGRQFEDLAGLSQALRDHPQLGACLVKRVYAWATGGATQPTDKPLLDWLGQSLAADGYRLPDLFANGRLERCLCDRARGQGRARAGRRASRGERAHARDRREVAMIRSAKLARISRRRVLKGMLDGAVVTVGLPLLDGLLSDSGKAFASGAPLPPRFVTWFWGLGGNSSVFVPKTTGAGYELPEELQPLERVKQHINVYTNFNAFRDSAPNLCHYTGWIVCRSGSAPIAGEDKPGETIDVTIARTIGRTSRFPTVMVTANGDMRTSFSYENSNSINAAEPSPLNLYTRLFGPATRTRTPRHSRRAPG
jgi:hypothetical protein